MYKFLVNGKEVTETEFYDQLEEAVNDEVETHFDDMLDECYPVYKIGDLTFYPSQIMRECDPIAYRCAISDEQSNRYVDHKIDFEDCDYFDCIAGVDFETIEVFEDEEDEDDEV